MRIKYVVILMLVLSVVCFSCIEEYWPNVEKYENILVIEGMVTNAEEPYYVRISKTSSLQDTVFYPVEEASVSIFDQDDEEIVLTSDTPGVWQTSTSEFVAETGNSYRVRVTLPDGDVYESVPEELLPSVNISEVTGETQNLPTKDPQKDLNGFQFFISGNSESANSNYYLWQVEHTWEYIADYMIHYYWNGIADILPIINIDTLNRCWKTERVKEIFTASLKDLTDKRIIDEPLHFIEGKSNKLRYGYSLLVKQYSISENSFEYWDALRSQSTDVESMYVSQPYQVIGNIRNINNPEAKVLGNFTVAGVTKKRSFFKTPPGIDHKLTLDCTPNPDWGFFLIQGKITFITVYEEGWGVVTPACFDCRYLGGQLTPPEFWEQE